MSATEPKRTPVMVSRLAATSRAESTARSVRAVVEARYLVGAQQSTWAPGVTSQRGSSMSGRSVHWTRRTAGHFGLGGSDE